MSETGTIRLPRVRLRDPRSMRYGGEALAAVAKAGNLRVRLQRLDGRWGVVLYVRGGAVPYHADWIMPLGDMPREAAQAAFMAVLAQLKLFHATVVLASPSAIRS